MALQDNQMPFFKSFSQLLIFTFLLFLLAVGTYYHRYPTDDDAWFAEESYWLLHDGRVRSEFFRGLLDWENHYLVSHKLFIAIGAVLMGLFPDSLYGIKCSGLLFFILLIGAMLYAVQSSKATSKYPKEAILLLFILLFANGLMVKMSFENRPEVMLAALGFCSFLLLRPTNAVWSKTMLAGILAGLALLSHLNGLIFIMAGFITLAVTKEYQKAFLFSFFAMWVGSFYFYDIGQVPNGLGIWWFQFSNDPATQNAFGGLAKLKVMLSFPSVFFESPEQMSVSVLLLAVGWFRRRQWKQLDQRLVIYSLSLLFSFWLITKRATGIYEVLFIPFMVVLILELIYLKSTPGIPMYLKISFLFYLLVGVVGNLQTIDRNLSGHLPNDYAALRKKIPDRVMGLVPLTFFFNEYKFYPKLLCHTNFALQMRQKQMESQVDSVTFFQWAYTHKAQFVLLDYLNDAPHYYPQKGKTSLGNYRLHFFDGRFALYILPDR